MTIVGPGALGRALARGLAASGWRVGLVGRDADATAAAAAECSVEVAGHSGDLAAAVAGADPLLLTVPDDALATVIASLVPVGSWTGRCVLHCSGSRGADLLSELAAAGATTGSLHPIMSLPRVTGGAAEIPSATPFTYEGDPAALPLVTRMVDDLGGRLQRLGGGGKALYHLASCLAGNLATVLLGLSSELLEEVAIEDGAELLSPLATRSVSGAAATEPYAALTGPLARGDVDTLTAHVTALRSSRRLRLLRAYLDLQLLALDALRREGRAPERHDELDELLRRELATLTEECVDGGDGVDGSV
ncbi:MAG: DUF2520 domain-containing protein [Acidobacteriota bacterium]